MNSEILSKDEYELQYFGFSSTMFFKEFKDMVKEIIQLTLTDVKQELINQGGDKEIIEKGIIKLYLLYMKSFKNAFSEFEIKYGDMFAIPENVLLEEDTYKYPPVLSEELKKLKIDVSNLEKQLIQEKVYLANCKQLKETFDICIHIFVKEMDNLIKRVTTLNKINKRTKKTAKVKISRLYEQKAEKFAQTAEGDIRVSIHLDKENAFEAMF